MYILMICSSSILGKNIIHALKSEIFFSHEFFVVLETGERGREKERVRERNNTINVYNRKTHIYNGKTT